MTTSRIRATLLLLCLFILPSGAEPATKHLHERGTNGQAETQADLARPPESEAEHVRVIQVCSGEHAASVGIAFMTWPSQHKGAYALFYLEEHIVDWPPLVVVNFDGANEVITHTFAGGIGRARSLSRRSPSRARSSCRRRRREPRRVIGWVFALYLMVPLAGAGPFHFKPDGQLGPYPTKQVCESARRAILFIDNPSERYFLEQCREVTR